MIPIELLTSIARAVKPAAKLTTLGLDDRLTDPPRLLDGMSISECSTVQPIAKSAFKDSRTGSLYLSFS